MIGFWLVLVWARDGFADHIDWDNQEGKAKSKSKVFHIHWDGVEDVSAELDDEALNDGDRGHNVDELLVQSNVFKDIEAVTTRIQWIEDDRVDEEGKHEGYYFSCVVQVKVLLHMKDICKEHGWADGDEGTSCTDSAFHVAG